MITFRSQLVNVYQGTTVLAKQHKSRYAPTFLIKTKSQKIYSVRNSIK